LPTPLRDLAKSSNTGPPFLMHDIYLVGHTD
jgi:hypothetical protein